MAVKADVWSRLSPTQHGYVALMGFKPMIQEDKISLEFKLSSLSQKGSPRHVKEPALPDLGRLRWAGLTANLLPLGSFPTALFFPISTPVAWFFSI
ncbi:hypothetical protein L195_g042896 [Trifolium pratense]|uniref:Uncharacterized protein n=1 Tax=Trifolium pratense TaxID=57577 RepID=A0A2K3M7Q1_TRIPR|nr:hypothetical protein L195_g042896 [Trifolium pratense]